MNRLELKYNNQQVNLIESHQGKGKCRRSLGHKSCIEVGQSEYMPEECVPAFSLIGFVFLKHKILKKLQMRDPNIVDGLQKIYQSIL